jgi:GGDEF domain-containing protein
VEIGLGSERCLTLLAEGTAVRALEVDSAACQEFKETIRALARQMPERNLDSDNLPVVKAILQEFESYRKLTEALLRERQIGWRNLTGRLFRELLGVLGIHPSVDSAAAVSRKIPGLTTVEEMQAFQVLLDEFLRPGGPLATASRFNKANRSLANDNAAGLRGGGAAVADLKKIMDRNGTGFVVLFRLGCLDVIGERFGLEAVQDSLMAVSAFLTQSLRGDDAVYHWSDSSLLVILESPASEPILAAAMQRIANNNRDITIKMGERTVMLRIPLSFEMTPIARFRSPEELTTISREPAARW